MNDGQPTFISSSSHTSSSIDLSISSRDLRLLTSSTTLQDLHDSDHFPVSVTVAETSSSTFLFTNKIPFTSRQLSALHIKLTLETSKFSSLIFSSSPSFNPLQKYELFYSLLTDTISSVCSQKVLPSQKRLLSCNRLPIPWWNSICAEAVENRSTLLRLYKVNPSWDNWTAFKRGNTLCRKILKREKRKGWKHLL